MTYNVREDSHSPGESMPKRDEQVLKTECFNFCPTLDDVMNVRVSGCYFLAATF